MRKFNNIIFTWGLCQVNFNNCCCNFLHLSEKIIILHIKLVTWLQRQQFFTIDFVIIYLHGDYLKKKTKTGWIRSIVRISPHQLELSIKVVQQIYNFLNIFLQFHFFIKKKPGRMCKFPLHSRFFGFSLKLKPTMLPQFIYKCTRTAKKKKHVEYLPIILITSTQIHVTDLTVVIETKCQLTSKPTFGFSLTQQTSNSIKGRQIGF